MTLSIAPINSLNSNNEVANITAGVDVDKDTLKQAAIDFEATYIAQMLTFSGLDKALTAGGGEDMSAFTSFYIQSFSEDIAESGGFGLADVFYERMLEMSGETSDLKKGEINVDFGKL
ncbi:MAG: rod-binding protein [Alphaproteobacteria bacterium]